jgi:hypothetical protein
MPTIDIITAAGPGSEEFLPDLAASIAGLEKVDGWDVGWLVTCDGMDGDENATRAEFARSLGATGTWANHTRYWSGASRNRALTHSKADWIVIVDADDELTPGALRAWVSAANDSGGTWCAFSVLDWYPDEQRTEPSPPSFPSGPIAPGAWLDRFVADAHHPAHPIAVLWPRRMLVTVGGWSASPAAQDAQPALVITSRWSGWWSDEPTHLYRKHDAQITHGGKQRPVEAVAQDARQMAVEQAALWRQDAPAS